MNRLDKPHVLKSLLVCASTFISLRLGALSGWLQMYVAALLLDYVTGVVSAAYRRELSSRVGLRGIMRKVASCLVVAAALLADEVIARAALLGGYAVNGILATAVVLWLILNELISVLENLAKAGVPLPAFLPRMLALLKTQVQKQGDALAEPKKHDPE